MKFDRIAGPDRFLIEDVILALANARGMLGWILAERTSEGMRQAALDRLDRQIALLTERAAALRQGEAAGPVARETPGFTEPGRTDAPPCSGDRFADRGGRSAADGDWSQLGPRLARMLLDLHAESPGVADPADPAGDARGTAGPAEVTAPALPLQDGPGPAGPDDAPVFRTRRGAGPP